MLGDHPLSRLTTRGMRLCGTAAGDFVNENVMRKTPGAMSSHHDGRRKSVSVSYFNSRLLCVRSTIRILPILQPSGSMLRRLSTRTIGSGIDPTKNSMIGRTLIADKEW